jgi:predicted GIY-YIG superfamily endonuclease
MSRCGHEVANADLHGKRVAACACMCDDKRFVYVLKSEHSRPRYYVGLTANVAARIIEHNGGKCLHTAESRPWHLHVVLQFADQIRAVRFEKYLKSGSGRAFAKRHFD